MATQDTAVVLPRTLASKAVTQQPGESVDSGNSIPRDNRTTVNDSLQLSRAQNNLIANIRSLTAMEGTFSSAVFNYVEVGMSGYTVMAYGTEDHQFSLEGSMAAMGMIARLNSQYDYTLGFADKAGFDRLLEASLLEVTCTGALCAELVLNKAKLPDKINLVAYETIDWVSRGPGKGKYPQQRPQTGDPIPLDIATFFVAELHKHTNKAYADSMMGPGVNMSNQFGEFVQDMRRAVRRQAMPRLTATLMMELVQAAATPEIKKDPVKMQEFMDSQLAAVTRTLNGLNPEDALVLFDAVKLELLKTDGEKADFVSLLNALSGQTATSLKSSPSILGLRINGSQSLSNTESLVFLKNAKSIQRPTEEVMSRILTLGVRLYGVDVYVEFKFDPINLRPEDELEAFKTMKNKRILELLSVGYITDDEAAWMIAKGPRVPGAPDLAGTQFMQTKGIDASNASPNGDPQGRALQSDQPQNGGGESNGDN